LIGSSLACSPLARRVLSNLYGRYEGRVLFIYF
jgi:hypothetical protein